MEVPRWAEPPNRILTINGYFLPLRFAFFLALRLGAAFFLAAFFFTALCPGAAFFLAAFFFTALCPGATFFLAAFFFTALLPRSCLLLGCLLLHSLPLGCCFLLGGFFLYGFAFRRCLLSGFLLHSFPLGSCFLSLLLCFLFCGHCLMSPPYFLDFPLSKVDPFVLKKRSPERINFLGQLLYVRFFFWQQKKQKK